MSHASVIAGSFVGASMLHPQDSPESKHISLKRITKTSSSAAWSPVESMVWGTYLCSGCGWPHEIHILDDDEDFGPKFGQIPHEESMHSSDSDSMESDPSEDSFHYGPSSFDPRITTNAAIVHAAITDHQQPPHAPSLVELLLILFVIFLFLLQPLFALLPHLALLLLILPILRPPFWNKDKILLIFLLVWPNCMQNYFPFVIFWQKRGSNLFQVFNYSMQWVRGSSIFHSREIFYSRIFNFWILVLRESLYFYCS